MEVPPAESAEDALDTTEKLREEEKYTGIEHRDPRELFTQQFCDRHSMMFAQRMNELCSTSHSSISMYSTSESEACTSQAVESKKKCTRQ